MNHSSYYIYLLFFCQAQKCVSFFVTVQSQLISFPAAIYPSLQPSCFTSIIISDPQMTLRDSCYLKHMHSSSRQRDGERGKREGWSGEMERWRSTRLTSSFLLLCSCIMHGTAVHISRAFWTWCTVYIHAQDGTFSLQSTALYGVGECVCLRGSYAICQMLWVAP